MCLPAIHQSIHQSINKSINELAIDKIRGRGMHSSEYNNTQRA